MKKCREFYVKKHEMLNLVQVFGTQKQLKRGEYFLFMDSRTFKKLTGLKLADGEVQKIRLKAGILS